ncbi:MAG: baseplate J/gp47 family protein [Pacificimonas sp.]|nr:baseplate J/gp47 family protein [Pacificimonas sp.]
MAVSSDLFNGVDLSRLPPPTVVAQLSYADILTAALADAEAIIPDFNARTDADPVVKLVQYLAAKEFFLRAQFNAQAQAVLLPSATGPDLDALAAFYNLERFIVTPANEDTGAPAVLETDEAFRARIVRAPEALSVAGPVTAYVALALQADARVKAASCISPNPGEVLVSILSNEGDGAADADLIATVNAFLSAEERRPLTDALTVQSATIVPFQIEAELRTFSGAGSQVAIAEARARLDVWLAENHRLGRDITEDGVLAALRGTNAGVSRVQLIGWQDVVCDETEAAWASQITTTHIGAGQ